MYTAIILGHGRRYRTDTLESLLRALERDSYKINPQEKASLEKQLTRPRSVIANLYRRRTNSEMIKKYVRKPYLPPHKIENTERVRAKIEYQEKKA